MNDSDQSSSPRWGAVVLDVDGTMYASKPVQRGMLARLLIHAVLHPIAGPRAIRAIQAYRQAQEELRNRDEERADLAAAQVELAAERSGRPAAEIVELVDRWMQRSPTDLIVKAADPSLGPFMRALRTAGIKTGVLSDYPVDDKLLALGIADDVDHAGCAQDPHIGRFKPHPRGLLAILERLGVGPADALYVGDRPEVDGEVARRAGCEFALIGREPGETPLTVRNFRELLPHLARPTEDGNRAP